jgi:PAS domain S-box-containing protein
VKPNDRSSDEEHAGRGASARAEAFERAPIALALVERSGRIGAANARLCALTGYSARALGSLYLWNLVHPTELHLGRDRMRALLDSASEPRHVELRCLRSDGTSRQFLLIHDGVGEGLGASWRDASGHELSSEKLPPARVARGEVLENLQLTCDSPSGARWVLCNSSHQPAHEGHPAVCVLAFQDITPLKQVESELARSVRDRDEFLSIAAHELRTPLTSLTLQLQGLVRHVRRGVQRGLTPETMAARIEPLQRGLSRLTKLVQNLLDISSLRSGRFVLEREEVDASRLVREVVGRLREELAWTHCPIALQVRSGIVGRWDCLRLEQVVTNLVTNAAKYGSGKPIEVTLDTEGGRARLTVRDHGIGIAPEDQARIFEPFERAVSTRHYGGFGLGLWIVRQIIESMGGSIRVESVPGEGSTFTVELECEEGRGDRASLEETLLPH